MARFRYATADFGAGADPASGGDLPEPIPEGAAGDGQDLVPRLQKVLTEGVQASRARSGNGKDGV